MEFDNLLLLNYNFSMGTLYIVATPIGNLEDISIRAIKTLFQVAYIACEDTRLTGRLLYLLREKFKTDIIGINGLDVDKKPVLISYYDEVEELKAPEIIDLLDKGHDIALVSDAGTPLLSDPGFKLIQLAIKQGVKIVPIPGPSSILSALVVSGFPTNDFRFIGYLPPKRKKRLGVLDSILKDSRPRGYQYTVILFEAPQRLREVLEDIQTVFGDIQMVLARELTKVHEEFIRGKISEIEKKTSQIKGELVVLFQLP